MVDVNPHGSARPQGIGQGAARPFPQGAMRRGVRCLTPHILRVI